MQNVPPLSRAIRVLVREEAGTSFIEVALLCSLALVLGLLMLQAVRNGTCG